MTSNELPAPIADFDAWAAGLQQRAQQFGHLRQRMDSMSATETSAGGAVRVSVDANGVPTSLDLTDYARGVDPAQLSAELMMTMRRAQAKLAQQVRTAVGETIEPGDEAAGTIVADYTRRFPEPEDGRPTDFGEDIDYGVLEEE